MGTPWSSVQSRFSKGNVACDVGGDFFNGNMSPEHVLPVHGIAENAGGRKSGDLGDEEKTQDGGKQQEGKPS